MSKSIDSNSAPMRVKRLSEKATLPSRGSDGSAGYDLSSYAFLLYFPHSLSHADRTLLFFHLCFHSQERACAGAAA